MIFKINTKQSNIIIASITMKMRVKLGILSSLLSTLCVLSQERESQVEEVFLQGKFLKSQIQESNFNLQIISKSEIENLPAQTIEDLLQYFSGMDIRRRGANAVQTDVSIRGGSFEQVLILLNGIRMNDSQTGHNSMNIPVDLSSVERIEIVKGPAARRYGQGAYAGVVNIITKVSAENKVKINLQAGDFGTYEIGATSTFGNKTLKNLFQINRSASEGYRYNTDSDIVNIFYQNEYAIKNGSIGLQGGLSDKKFGANGFYASPAATEQYEELQSSIVALKIHQKYDRFNVNSNLFWRRGQDMYLFNREKPEIYRNMHIGHNYGIEGNASYESTMGLTGFGAELRREDLTSNNLGNQRRDVVQLFLEHHFSFFHHQLKLTPGISWANYSGVGNFFYPGLDIGFNANDRHRFFGNIGRVNRLPSFTDLYYVSMTEKGNAQLTPENGWSTEIGYQYHKPFGGLKASVFFKQSKDAIDWTKENITDVWQAYNVGEISTKGIELEVNTTIPKFYNTNFSINYTFLENEYHTKSQYSRYLIDNLKHQFIGRIQNKIGSKITNEISYRYLERVNSQSYHLIDEKLSFKLQKFEMFFLLNNITNTQYTEAFGVPMPGRWFHLGFTYWIQ